MSSYRQRDYESRHDSRSRKRTRSRSPPPWRKDPRSKDHDEEQRRHDRNMKEQTRLNALQEAEQAREWVSQEDTFVLKQAKKKAEIRVKEGRAKPIDWLAVNLRVIDKDRNPLDDEIADDELDVVDPESILEGLDQRELEDLQKDIEVYIGLETNKMNNEFWRTMKILCADRRSKLSSTNLDGSRAVGSVAADVDKLLGSKTLPELITLEEQIVKKLNSNEPIDVDYWNELLRSLRIWKAKASLKKVYSKAINQRLAILRKQQQEEAETVRKKLETILGPKDSDERHQTEIKYRDAPRIEYSPEMDPEPLLKLRYEDKGLETIDEKEFLANLAAERKKIQKMGYVPHKPRAADKSSASKSLWPTSPKAESSTAVAPTSRFAAVFNDDFSQATKALYEREVARGVSDNEEIFTGEEEVNTTKPAWADKYRPRKPRYFNRVQMGYEWNKYNQTHYDHDNPPPKVVQGYKFNIFYPDLIDKSKAPTYRIEREGGRKRGQSFAPAGEEDTCLIRFIAGPPYEDIAFRIVDKEWDYSAKRERGFKSSFEKGILQLHFQLKKIYYRK
ncbi:mid region of cactin-domain-containing protein [Sphaerosporella brunnea]|uniref:Splicing factor Cactin n=1 Tax=Sphaerosporella brunnea TaxID=1250544 RepID=A0A5J5F465_9PEZI|nr:mid region of cactin-domain-containing protein [Sphaerosporella brunnea]